MDKLGLTGDALLLTRQQFAAFRLMVPLFASFEDLVRDDVVYLSDMVDFIRLVGCPS